MNPEFLTIEDVLDIHEMQLARFGGGGGLRDQGLLGALVFLDINGIAIERESETLYDLTMAAAEGRVDKDEIAVRLARVASTA